MKQGEGTFIWANGTMYEGEWLAGKQHGKGVFMNKNKDYKSGIWENGKRLKN